MAQHLHIPGLAEAVEQERKLRNEIYLNAPRDICGVLCNQITPRILARITATGSPFVCGGRDVTAKDCIQFLWICSTEFSTDSEKRDAFVEKSLCLDLDAVEDGIEEFLRDTYLDSPKSDTRGKPYYSLLASIEFTMSAEPFRWDWDEKTQDIPLRRIFQLMNVKRDRNGGMMRNPISDKVQQDYLDKLNSGEIEIPAEFLPKPKKAKKLRLAKPRNSKPGKN